MSHAQQKVCKETPPPLIKQGVLYTMAPAIHLILTMVHIVLYIGHS